MLEYKLEKATNDDINLIIKYKLNSITEYTNNLSKDEIIKINNYVNNNIPKQINDYKVIKMDDKIIGCLLVTDHLDGILLDEIFIEEKYRNNGIGSDIIKGILSKNNSVYLWVYKRNLNAYALYKKFGFYIIEETENRFFMKYSKLEKARKFCKEVRKLAKNYDLPFFVVTDGASSTSNNGCEAVRNARENHIKWEIKNNHDPNADWSDDIDRYEKKVQATCFSA